MIIDVGEGKDGRSMETNLGNTRHHAKCVMSREEIIEECKFMARFEPLSLERAKTICDAIEDFLMKYPFLRRIMKEEGEAMLKEMRNERDRQGVPGLWCKRKEQRRGK